MSWIAPDTIGWTLSDSAEHAFADLKDKEMSIRLRARMDPVLASSADGVLGGTYINCYKDHILVNRNKSYNGAASAGASTKFDPVDLFVPTDPPPEPDGAWLTAPQEMPSFLKSENLEPAQEFEPKATEYGQEPVDAIEHFSGSITDEAPPADDIDESSTSYTGEDAGDGLGPYDAAIQAYEPEVIQLSDQSQADQYNQNVAGQGPANQAEELTEITPSATPPPPPGDPVISYSTAEPVPAKEAYPYNQPKTEAQKETKASVPRPGIKAVVSSRGKPVSRSAPASLDEEIDVGIEANLGDLSAGNAIEINCIFDPALEYAGAKFTGIAEENWVIEPKNGSVSFMCLESTRKLSGKTLNIKTRLRLKDNIAHSLLNKDDPLETWAELRLLAQEGDVWSQRSAIEVIYAQEKNAMSNPPEVRKTAQGKVEAILSSVPDTVVFATEVFFSNTDQYQSMRGVELFDPGLLEVMEVKSAYFGNDAVKPLLTLEESGFAFVLDKQELSALDHKTLKVYTECAFRPGMPEDAIADALVGGGACTATYTFSTIEGASLQAQATARISLEQSFVSKAEVGGIVNDYSNPAQIAPDEDSLGGPSLFANPEKELERRNEIAKARQARSSRYSFEGLGNPEPYQDYQMSQPYQEDQDFQPYQEGQVFQPYQEGQAFQPYQPYQPNHAYPQDQAYQQYQPFGDMQDIYYQSGSMEYTIDEPTADGLGSVEGVMRSPVDESAAGYSNGSPEYETHDMYADYLVRQGYQGPQGHQGPGYQGAQSYMDYTAFNPYLAPSYVGADASPEAAEYAAYDSYEGVIPEESGNPASSGYAYYEDDDNPAPQAYNTEVGYYEVPQAFDYMEPEPFNAPGERSIPEYFVATVERPLPEPFVASEAYPLSESYQAPDQYSHVDPSAINQDSYTEAPWPDASAVYNPPITQAAPYQALPDLVQAQAADIPEAAPKAKSRSSAISQDFFSNDADIQLPEPVAQPVQAKPVSRKNPSTGRSNRFVAVLALAAFLGQVALFLSIRKGRKNARVKVTVNPRSAMEKPRSAMEKPRSAMAKPRSLTVKPRSAMAKQRRTTAKPGTTTAKPRSAGSGGYLI
jgi:hypothetical protein